MSMTPPSDGEWQHVGLLRDFQRRRCTRVYARDGEGAEDVAVFAVNTDEGVVLHAITADCAHEGGPLEVGDIEDFVVRCPWHEFEFDIRTGHSPSGLLQTVYPIRSDEDGLVYIQAAHVLRPFDLSNQINRKECRSITTKRSVDATHQVRGTEVDLQFLKDDDQLDTLHKYAIKILMTGNPTLKCSLTRKAASLFLQEKTGERDAILELGEPVGWVPEMPVREELAIVDVGKTQNRRGGGNVRNRIAMLHSLANIEQWAIDLAWDIIARFGHENMPHEFYAEFVQVADDEARHYELLVNRLNGLGAEFGDLAIHAGLWQSATETKDSLLKRLAIVHMVHEARGLDVHPKTIGRFQGAGDKESVAALNIIYEEEITHVTAGVKWFKYICERDGLDPIRTFHDTVRANFRGPLKPPFNHDARNTAGFTSEWYVPLTQKN
eukprot:Clim_evm148s147 gene=Clim_evmTU148s147